MPRNFTCPETGSACCNGACTTTVCCELSVAEMKNAKRQEALEHRRDQIALGDFMHGRAGPLTTARAVDVIRRGLPD